jgi:predicted DCC family thiol-disulfide oxidoreductase YuxK
MTAEIVETAEIHLPNPVENPSGHVVIYDGRCKFCTAGVGRLARWDARSRKLSFLSLHSPETRTRYPQLTYDQLMEEMYVVDRSGGIHKGAEAFRFLTTQLPRLYGLVPFLYIPFSLPLWQWAYRQVARRRYRIMGKTGGCEGDTCRIHFK